MTDNDIIVDTKSLIDGAWNASNTNSRTPTVTNIADVKRIDQRGGDFILLWELDYFPEDNASGALQKKTRIVVMLDIRTAFSRAHAVLMRKELRRILNANQVDVFSDDIYDISDIIEERDLSSKMVKLFRYTFKWQLEQHTLAI